MNRVIPNARSVKSFLHESKHAFVKRFARNKKVLDFGCGSGFGASIIGEVADSVVGIDAHVEAVEYAKEHFERLQNNLAFKQRDLEHNIDDIDSDFDLVYSLDVIEHLHDVEIYLKNIIRAMKDDGVFICATPNIVRTKNTNPFHVREYTYEEFRELLLGCFNQVSVLAQEKNDASDRLRALHGYDRFNLRRFVPKPGHHLVRRLLRIPLFHELSADHYPITGNIPEAYAFVALCWFPKRTE